MIKRIKEDLTKISKGPWDWYDSDPNWLWQRTGPGKHDFGKCLGVEAVEASEEDRNFIAHSPERIALLMEYYEAAEMEFRYVGTSGDTEFYRRLQAVREKLEGEDG